MNRLNTYFTTIYYYLHPEHKQVISHQSVRILQFIQKEDSVTVRHVAEKLGISHNTASEHVKKLELNGWVTKNRAENDQRIVHLQLTDEGLHVVRANTELDANKLSDVLATLTVEQQQQIEEAFRLLSEAAENVHNH
ncbi:MarR family winged helix-turn-helix transcriptional regulator [Rummeliibacillus pycnus]|uniref:MarR family winged helix-turn-helix transcriptional regulator n=1 Tax=Rummeliibacillus pycnus TaxID=101070 RepID=UPI003D2D512F